ncbi:hypothetical protein BVY04_04655 [bacterium M21]|nr:hypothetical protein BVY04_04655 [bacterium M21]
MSMTAVYTPLCNIVIDHQYFDGGRMKGLTVAPTASCEQQMDRFRLRYQQTSDGVEILYPRVDGTRKTPFINFDEPLALGFYLCTNNSWFYNVSDLSEDTSSLYYCDNQPTEADDSEHPLKGGALLRPSHCYPKTSLEELTGQDVTIFDSDGSRVVANGREFVTKVYQTEDEAGEPCEQFIAGEVIPLTAFAFVNIFLGTGPLADPELYDPTTQRVTGQTYRLTIAPRQSHWRYYLLSKADPITHKQLSLGESNSISCKIEKRKKKLTGGESAYVLTTDELIERSETPKTKIVLEITRHGNTIDEVELPSPGEGVLNAYARSSKRHYSEMIVYL